MAAATEAVIEAQTIGPTDKEMATVAAAAERIIMGSQTLAAAKPVLPLAMVVVAVGSMVDPPVR